MELKAANACKRQDAHLQYCIMMMDDEDDYSLGSQLPRHKRQGLGPLRTTLVPLPHWLHKVSNSSLHTQYVPRMSTLDYCWNAIDMTGTPQGY